MSKYSYEGIVELAIDADPEVGDMPEFDINEFMSNCSHSNVKEARPHQYTITGPFDDLWEGWVNYCDDEPSEFMERVISGHDNCPQMEIK